MDPSLRELVWRRAAGRCEYCHLAQEHDAQTFCIDHIIAKKHRGPTSEANLALACFHCNTSKGTDIASIDPDTRSLLRLFNPRLDDWTKDFEWSGPLLVGLTGIGRVTVHILSINAD